jgi:hypothetical protein
MFQGVYGKKEVKEREKIEKKKGPKNKCRRGASQ